jgi:electron-transferring-flavoprotein dehydrogenase
VNKALLSIQHPDPNNVDPNSGYFDVVIVGAGPAGLAAAIRLKQWSAAQKTDCSICIVEKASAIGGHILSGAVFETKALTQLIPEWKTLHAPLVTAVTADRFYYLTQNHKIRLPTPQGMHNHGNYIISLGALCIFLAEYAQHLGIEIYPGFAATHLLLDPDHQICGIQTGDMGQNQDGSAGSQYQRGMRLYAKKTILAEGARGSLSEVTMQHFELRKNSAPQTYALGIKELWQVSPEHHQPGLVIHTVGWPLDTHTYGGSFIYHLDHQQVAFGFVVGLDYKNPTLSPFEETQRLKHHPHIKPLFEGGQRLAYGARALNEGGFQSIPTLTFPGGLLVGCAAGFLDVGQMKGSHNAIYSGILAAEAILQNKDYDQLVRQSAIYKNLYKSRNLRPGFKHGRLLGLAHAACDSYLFRGCAPWTLQHRPDHTQLQKFADCKPIAYPKPDGKISFDRLSSVFLSNLTHREHQPCHLELTDPRLATTVNWAEYQGPEVLYCPAGVYEYLNTTTTPYLQINAQNCVHCKTCDIKDPRQNIRWTPPEGGNGPQYSNL